VFASTQRRRHGNNISQNIRQVVERVQVQGPQNSHAETAHCRRQDHRGDRTPQIDAGVGQVSEATAYRLDEVGGGQGDLGEALRRRGRWDRPRIVAVAAEPCPLQIVAESAAQGTVVVQDRQAQKRDREGRLSTAYRAGSFLMALSRFHCPWLMAN